VFAPPHDQQASGVVGELSCLIPTFRRPAHLASTVETLFASQAVPATVLISEGSSDPNDREQTRHVIEECGGPNRNVHLISAPPLGTLCGNKNHLLRHADTALVMYLDDDANVHPLFISMAVGLIYAGEVDIVSAPWDHVGCASWFTRRGHFRPSRPGEPEAVTLPTTLGIANLFRKVPLDERIIYGSEELDFNLRLQKLRPAPRTVCIACPSTDRAGHRSAGLDEEQKMRFAEQSRGYVSVKRYWESRWSLAMFLAEECAANVMRGRRPLPRAAVPDQWKAARRRLVGLERDLPFGHSP
jgi:hypothetical protein